MVEIQKWKNISVHVVEFRINSVLMKMSVLSVLKYHKLHDLSFYHQRDFYCHNSYILEIK